MSEGKKMKFKKIFALFLCIVISAPAMSGCGSSEKNLAGTVGNLKSNGKPVTSYADNGSLGYGYNLIEKSCFTNDGFSDNCAVLNTKKLVKDGLIYSYSDSNSKIEANTIVGTDTESYAEDLSASFNISATGPLFKGTFSASNSFSYDKKKQYSSTDSFITTLASEVVKHDYINVSTLKKLKEYMDPDFKTEINDSSISPETIISKYGTHVILNAELGGRMELNYKYHNYNQTSKQTLKDKATAAYNEVKSSTSGEFSDETKKFIENSELSVKLRGGKSIDLNTLSDVRSSYSNWFKSIENNQSLSFIGIKNVTTGDKIGAGSSSSPYDNINRYSLWPIWELADSTTRQDDIKKAYKTMLENSGSEIANIQPTQYVKNIYFGYDKAAEKAKSNLKTAILNDENDSDYVLLNDYNLNDHAHGNHHYMIYMGYTLTTDPNQAVRDIKLDYRENKHANQLVDRTYNNANYKKIDLDLTKGTGGSNYITLFYTHDAAAGNPLKAVGFEFGENKYKFAEDGNLKGWTSVGIFGDHKVSNKYKSYYTKFDVNTGAGGTDIFIWKKR